MTVYCIKSNEVCVCVCVCVCVWQRENRKIEETEEHICIDIFYITHICIYTRIYNIYAYMRIGREGILRSERWSGSYRSTRCQGERAGIGVLNKLSLNKSNYDV
jgi:hypothetical protein